MNQKTISFLYLAFRSFIAITLFLSCKNDKAPSSELQDDPEIHQITTQIDKNPESGELYYLRARKYYDKQRYDKAILDLQKAISLDSINPDYFHLLSDAYLDYFNPDEAQQTLQKVLRIYPERIPTLLKLAELKYILEDYDGSMLTLNEIIRLDGQNGEAYFMLGMNFKSINDKERARNAFQTAVEMDSGITDAWLILGEMYEAENDPKALQYYESAILSDPESMEARHAKAYYLQNNDDISSALDIYKEIIVMNKNYSAAYLNSGYLYLDLDSLDKAFEQFDLLTTVAPTNYLGFYMRGVVSEMKGNKEEALSDYESAYNLNKNDKKVEESLISLRNQLNNNN